MSDILFTLFIGIFATGMGALLCGFFYLSIRFPLFTILTSGKTEQDSRHEAALGLCTGLAILLAVAAFFCAVYSAYFISSGVRTEGVVTEIKTSTDKEGFPHSISIYQYADKQGGSHQDKTDTNDGEPLRVGDHVPVIYLSNDPKSSRVDRFTNHWLAPLTILGAAIGAGLVSAILNRLHKRRTANAASASRRDVSR